MTTRLTSSRFVGRIGELAELQHAVREAASGRPGLVLLGGDSGVGKTRLVGELEQSVAQDGEPQAIVLRGESVEQTDGELPYAPLLSALRPLVRECHPALEAVSAGNRAQLATILPGLDNGQSRDERPDPSAQLRVFEAVLELLDVLGDTAPVVLILEDIHWADRSTRTFIAYLARSLRTERILLVVTYRGDELHRRHPLRPLLSELERLERAHRIEVSPFDRDEVAQALTDILGSVPEEGLVSRLFTRSEGNPLYTEELLAAGLDGRGAAPQSLRDAFIVRIERLSPEAQLVARAVAVGRALDEPALETLTGLDHTTVQTALREAVSEQVLIADHDDRFGFRHALLREALYDDLLPGERGELHLALARHLESRMEGSGEPELELAASAASNYAAAGDQPAALRTTVIAASAAERALAYGEAADLTDRALELWPRVTDPERVAGLDHVELLRRAAGAHSATEDRSRGETLINQALRELDPELEPARYAALLGRLSRIMWSLNRGAEAVATGERALAMLPEGEPSRVRPLLLAWLARTRFLRGRFRDVIPEGEEALEAAVATGNRLAETEVLNTLGMARVALGDVDEGVASLRRAIELARERDDIDSLSTAYSNLADMLSMVGRTGEALATVTEGLASVPRRHSRGRDWMKLTLSEMSFEAGEWAAARANMIPELSAMVGTLYMFRELRQAELALGVGDEDAAERSLEAVTEQVRVSSEPQWIALFGALSGELLARRRELDAARAVVEQALDRIEVCTDDVMRIAQISAAGVRVEADRAERARDLHEPAERRDALARAKLHVQRLEAAVQDGGAVEAARLAEGRAEMARARGRAAHKEWAAAAAKWEAIERPYPAALARWRQAEALAAAGDRAGAGEAGALALAAATSLGSEWLVREVQALCERARLDVALGSAGNGAASDGRAETAAEDPFGLTPRERQVLALLAEGATNRQIGAALFMAEKTASVHVSRILAKLGVQGRTQAAAVAHRQHLA